MRRFVYLHILLLVLSAAVKSQVVHEQVYVHTDRNYYQTGEIIWFSIYNVDEQRKTGSTISSIAYAELLDAMNTPLLQAKIKLDSGRGSGSLVIPANANTGVYTFRCYTNWMKNFGAATFFNKQVAIVNAGKGAMAYQFIPGDITAPTSLLLHANVDKKVYDKREKVTLTISAKDASGGSVPADVSVAVYRLDSLITPDPTTISFRSEPAKPDSIIYPPEINAHVVTARMINRNTRMRSKNIPAYLSVMDEGNSFYNGISDENGNIRWLVTKLNPADSIVVQTNSYYHPDQQIEVDHPFFGQYAAVEHQPFIATNGFGKTVLAQSINAQVTALYYETQNNTFTPHISDTTPFYYKANVRYILDDYIRFSKLEDVLREYVRPVGVARRQNRIHLSVFNQNNRYLSDAEPLVIVDGIPVFNFNTLFAYDPLKVKTIDVVTDRYYKSGSMFPGIIDLTTYRRRTDGQLIDENASVLAYEIVQKERRFYSPAYTSPSSTHLPDFRETLYWNPAVQVNSGTAQIAFYTADLPGEYFISVQGISQGNAVAATTRFTVK